MNNWTEDRLQQEVIFWFNRKYLKYDKLLYSIPNGGNRNIIEAKKLKSTGVKRGVSDLHLAILGGPYYIELKRPNGKGIQSVQQLEWQKLIEEQGFEYFISNDLDEIKSYIDKRMEFMAKAMLDLNICKNTNKEGDNITCKNNCLTRCVNTF